MPGRSFATAMLALAFSAAALAAPATASAPDQVLAGGKQAYEIPSTIDAADYTGVWVRCERYSVPLGVRDFEAR